VILVQRQQVAHRSARFGGDAGNGDYDGEFLGWAGCGEGRALVLDAEQGLRTVKRRLREARLDDSDRVDYVRVPDGLSLDSDKQHVAAVEAALAEGGYSLAVPK